jgi:hypothetical protein
MTAAVATMAFPMAATVFGHLAAAASLLGAYLLARRRSTRAAVGAGLLAGIAVLFEYTAAIGAALLLAYAVARVGRARAGAAFAAGALPAAAALAAYNAAAFGSPVHFSYRYESATFAQQHRGFFGIGVPSGSALATTLFGHRGLFIVSPVLLLAAASIILLWRRGARADAALAASITVAFVIVAAGYFDPYGGLSPGPRYFAPALPFLALGLAPAYSRWPRLTGAAAAVSAVGALVEAGTWGPNFDWSTVWWWLGAPRLPAMAAVATCVALAAALTARDLAPLVRPRKGGP